jgi:hypothetical protein
VNTAKDTTFYARVVKITYDYLGPAADRFVSRQVRNHLDKEPEELEKHELAGMIDWFSMAMAILSGDERVVHRYKADLQALAES